MIMPNGIWVKQKEQRNDDGDKIYQNTDRKKNVYEEIEEKKKKTNRWAKM